ncbi:protein N-terminal glutamine amidohydrolase isoform X2 [Eurytemora carolleeae]|uniref:protein N-terminal glutamine amidohydrolase isoform X2 n=1 Tax=Eurytemora carolleeae TaxID=1294199 RepID=UPI000C75F741|nr:protein N-terminal glutamine amidohydrolase isoform X2 [Eurytemora carolleeae]|eukprot:XP_023326804.1 protein N-terminal glutamine amidohydrolase-like isoform X2 [Eurytemora affinis]
MKDSKMASLSNESPLRSGNGTGKTASATVRPLSASRIPMPANIPPAVQCSYAACYCEENVYKLCESVKETSGNEVEKCVVVFVSNKKRVVPLWRQKAGREEEKLVIWDYHVILLYKPDHRTLVYDLDSELPFPTYFHKYVTETFRTDAILNQEYHRLFRVIPATTFLATFASDRRHMRKEDGSWLKPAPTYPCISSPTSQHKDLFRRMVAG